MSCIQAEAEACLPHNATAPFCSLSCFPSLHASFPKVATLSTFVTQILQVLWSCDFSNPVILQRFATKRVQTYI